METPLLSNAASFFAAVRVDLFGGAIEQTQVDGINSILQAWPEGTDPRFVAYGLATAYHETGADDGADRRMGPGQGKAYGIPCGPYQQRYYGRGFVHLTWLSNYERAEKAILGSDLAPTPDNAPLPAIAAEVLVRGISEGWFTGKRLADFFPLGAPETHDWLGAREIVNGQDRAAQIAGLRRALQRRAGGRALGAYEFDQSSPYIADLEVKFELASDEETNLLTGRLSFYICSKRPS